MNELRCTWCEEKMHPKDLDKYGGMHRFCHMVATRAQRITPLRLLRAVEARTPRECWRRWVYEAT